MNLQELKEQLEKDKGYRAYKKSFRGKVARLWLKVLEWKVKRTIKRYDK